MRLRRQKILAVCWGCAFCAGLIYASFNASRLARQTRQLELESSRLEHASQRLRDAVSQLRVLGKEYDFLNSLVSILPQEKGSLRTQQAIFEEVRLLRRQIASRVSGQWQVFVDTKANKLFVKKGLKLIWQADCSAGRGHLLVDKKTGRKWQFVTPRGEFKVIGKMENPEWVKPDWAFVEMGLPIPPPGDPSRKVEGELGKYVLNLGDGYLIHGTKDESSLGRSVSHGCVRLGASDLERLYKEIPIGARVFVY